jgi:DNA-binding transcriptional LysR family regulator
MADRFSGIGEFVAVAEAGGFAAAAGKLNLSRSAVGKAVARLEARIGARLLHRTTRVVSLTREGEVFYEYCLGALSAIRAGEAGVESGKAEPVGKVRVTVPVIFGRRCVAPLLYEVAREHQGLTLEVAFSDRPADLIEEGYDLAVRNGPLPAATGLMTRTLARQRMTVCASPAYLALHGRPLTLAELASHQAIVYADAARERSWLFPDGRGRTVEVAANGRIRLNDLEAMGDAAAAGLGLAWLPCWLVRQRVASGELVRVLDELPAHELGSHALWPQAPFLPSRVRVLIDALATRLPAMME